MSDEQVNTRSAFERHGQSLIQVIIAALCIWMAKTTSDTSKDLAVLTERMESVKIEMTSMKDFNKDRYTGADARRDAAIDERRFTNIENRIKSLENKHQGN